MGAYRIVGGEPLNGEVTIHGAKNSVLPILAATLLTADTCVLHNCPAITDVDSATAILTHLGCKAERCGETLFVDTRRASETDIPVSLMRRMRAAVIFLGPLLARFSEATASPPGGCELGARPIDLHLRGLRSLGAEIVQEGIRLSCRTDGLRGGTVTLPFPSVGATENLLLASMGCGEDVILCNAAREPEIGDLVGFLRACGADIAGEGTSVLRIRAGKKLHGAEYTVQPDRMEAVTYLSAAAATRGSLVLRKTRPEHYEAVLRVLERGGCKAERRAGDTLALTCNRLRAVSPIQTAPYDGFPTDAQAPVMAAMATAEGISIFEETIFSDRFRHVPALRRMGAHILTTERYAVVTGVPALCGASVSATDLRGGAAMVIAALSADGESVVEQTEHIERGYSALAEQLRACGAKINHIEGQSG